MSALDPVIKHAVNSYGGGDHKIVGGYARAVAAEAVKSYNPASGAGLSTWVTGHLQGLSRFRRKVGSPLGTPERTQLDAYQIHKATQELQDKLGYEPDVLTLSDHLKMPVARIADVRKQTRAIVPESAGLGGQQAQPADWSAEALEYVIHDLEPVDRKIVEHRTGYGGADILAPKDLASKLKLPPSNLSRRSMKIAARVAEIESALNQVYGEEGVRHV